MRGFLRTTLFVIVVFAVVLAIYRLFGGDLPGLLSNIWAFLYTIIQGLADIFMQIFQIFGFGG